MRRALAGAVGILLPILAGAPAGAAEPRLGPSWNGTTWTGSLSGELLGVAGAPQVWVPGDSAIGQFYVRNQSADGAMLRVEYRLGEEDALFGPSDLHVSARVGDGAWVSLAPEGRWLPLEAEDPGSDEPTRGVAMRAVFDPASTNQSQSEVAPLRFRVTLSEVAEGGAREAASPGGGPGDGSEPPPEGPGGSEGLPGTGTDVEPWVAVLGGLLLGAGLALVARSRRAARHG